ncbi:MAG: siderophore-interacting protein [Bacteroidota bacterium]
MLRVIDKKQLTSNMIRISLQGEQLRNIDWKPGCYVKLKMPNVEKQKLRTYTARSYDEKNQALDIDFAIHQPAGLATKWAIEANIGDEIELLGPGHLRIDSTKGDWYLFAADMSALPAAISVIEALPENAKGYAFFEVIDEGDKQEFSIPSGFEVQWLIHPEPKVKSDQQLTAIKSIQSLDGIPNIFVAGELSTIREIKDYIKGAEKFKDAFTYISSYWKIGLSEEEHKQAKRLMKG